MITEDDLSNLYSMYGAVMGGGVAPVALEDAKRLESLGFVKLFPAGADDHVDGEIDPQYTFSMTDDGTRVARDYRASWSTYSR